MARSECLPRFDEGAELPHTLDWRYLLPDARDGVTADVAPLARSPYQRDHDRILFSGPFRRLADKTQVFPLPIDDHVHSRLTHSLEVATIGRSLGNLVGRRLVESGVTLPEGRDARDVGDCVAAACLAHDLGNPPFGHVGERAIREYFALHAPAGLLDPLTARERSDLLRYEGNAQAFRILTRLEQPWRGRGLGLTYATLGAFMKYPCTSDVPGSGTAGRSAKKHGLMAREVDAWARAAESLGLARRAPKRDHWPRHPLAFLTEAADDIAYLLLDLEDGFRLKHVSEADYLRLVRPLTGASGTSEDATRRLAQRVDQLDRAGWLRARAIDTLIHQLTETFLARLDAILEGSFDDELRKSIPLAGELVDVEKACIQQCYEARDVLKMELAGAEAIQGLLQHFVQALLEPGTLRGEHQRRLRGMVISDEGTRYDQLVRITDHVAGMTDNYAVRLYRELRGMRYPGGRD
jgi:dGTPase